MEAEKDAEGHADAPVGDELRDEGGVGVAGSAEGSGGGDLDAVEELKAGGDEQQGDGGGDDAGVGREEAGDLCGDGQQEHGGAEHESCAGADAAPSGGYDVGGGADADAHTSDGVADADGGCGRDGEGHHEGGAGALQGDLVTGEREAAEGGDERGDEGEDGDLDEDGGSGGSAEDEEVAEVLVLDAEVRALAKAGEEAVVVVAVGTPDGEDQDAHEVEAREAGGPGGAGDAVGWDAVVVRGDVPAVSEDEEPVSGGVDEVCGDEREGDGAAVVGGLQVAAEGEVEQQREGSVVEALHGGDGLGEDGVVYGQAQEKDGGDGEDRDEQGGESEGHDEAVEEPAIGFLILFGAEGL